MVVFPVVATGVSTVFAVLLFVRFSRRKGLPDLAWGIALAMYAIASLAVAAGSSGGWDKTLFKIYWLFGALLNVPYLALGSIALYRKRWLSAIAVFAVAVGTLWALGVVVQAKAGEAIGPASFDVPLGKDVWGKQALVAKMGTYYSIPAYLIVVAVAVGSSRKRGGAAPPVNRVRGNWLIAGGATIVAIGSAVARYGRGAYFSVFLAVAVVTMFVGFVLASRPAGARPADAPAVDPERPAE